MTLTLTGKIFLAFGFALSTFAASALYGVRELHSVGEDLRSINDGHLALARLTGQLETHQQNRFRDLKRGLSEADPVGRDVILRIASGYFPEVVRSRIAAIVEVCQREIVHSERPIDRTRRDFYGAILAQVDGISKKHETVDELTDALRARVRARAPADDLAETIERLESELRGEVYQLTRRIEEETERAVRRAERKESNALWRVVAMTAVALLLGVLLTLLSARALAPIQRLVAFARAISRGDYERKLETKGDDELSALAEELRALARARKTREEELDRQQAELEQAYHRVADLKRYHESVVQSLKTAVIVTDRDLVVTSVNRAVGSCLDIAPERVRGTRLPDLPIGATLVERIGPLEALLDRAHTANLSAVQIGQRRFDLTVAPFQNDHGGVIGLVLSAQDVTEAAQTKEALIRSERLAAIGRMSAHVTHEIRNPLSSIGINAELLASMGEGPDGGDAAAICQAIIREVDRLTAITDEYLRFARLPRPELRSEDPVALIASIARFVERDCAAAQISLRLDVDRTVPRVTIDADQIRQAILNLVRNAKESMPQGGQLNLAITPHTSGVAIQVHDTGTGIDEGDLDRIFDPFYSTKLTGTGLGLALVQQIVAEHGGRVEVRSRRGQGTEVSLIIPVTQHPGPARLSPPASDFGPAGPG